MASGSMPRISTHCSHTSTLTSELPSWAVAPGIPSEHAAHAALHAALIIDRRGSRVSDARESYWHHATGGIFPPPDLRRGEHLLIDCNLVHERDGVLYPTPDLEGLLEGTIEDAMGTLCVLAFSGTQSSTGPLPPVEELDAAVADLVPDPARREQILLALGRRFDAEYQRTLGEIGEEIVV